MSWHGNVFRIIDPFPDSKVHGANMGPAWGDRNQVGPMWATWTLLSELLVNEPVTVGFPF